MEHSDCPRMEKGKKKRKKISGNDFTFRLVEL